MQLYPECNYLLLDLDGVLIETKGLHAKAFNSAMVQLGLPVFVGEEAITTNQKLDDMKIFDPKLRKEVKSLKDVAFRAMFPEIRYSPWLPPFIAQARRRFKGIGLCTNCSGDVADAIIQHCGLRGSFDAVITQAHLKNPKPHPEIYLRGMAAIGAYPKQTLVFEDSESGVQAATAAGAVVEKTNYTDMMERFRTCAF